MKQKIITMLESNLEIEDIILETDLPNYELLNMFYYILSKESNNISSETIKRMRNLFYQNFSFLNMQDEKVLIISDTHIGSSEQNIEYLKQAEYTAKQEQIKKIFHLGDIGNGQIDKTMFNKMSKEIEYLLEVYNCFSSYTQYILGGNHDEKYKNEGYDILKLLKQTNPNIVPIGYRQAYFRIFNKVIALEHESKLRKKHHHLVNPNFIIAGHSHKCRFKEKEVYVPSLSDVVTNKNETDIEPGFLILETSKEKKKVNLDFSRYQTTENGPEKILQKTYTLK